MARERSSANCATRWIAEFSSSPCTGQLAVVLRQHGFEVRELSGQLARGQQALLRYGRREWNRLSRTRWCSASVESQQRLQLVHRFFRNQGLQFSANAFEFLAGAFSMCARRCPSVATMVIDSGFSTIRAAIQRVARFFVGDREDRCGRSCRVGPGRESSRRRRSETRAALGKLDCAMPTILVFERPQRMLTQ